MDEKRLQKIFRKSTKNSECIGTQEGYTVEYKQNFGWGSMPEYVRAMAAMANNRGRHIIFGIKDILVFNNTHANYLKKNQEDTSCNMKELFTDHRVRHAV